MSLTSRVQFFFLDCIECHTCPFALYLESANDCSAQTLFQNVGKPTTMLTYSNCFFDALKCSTSCNVSNFYSVCHGALDFMRNASAVRGDTHCLPWPFNATVPPSIFLQRSRIGEAIGA